MLGLLSIHVVRSRPQQAKGKRPVTARPVSRHLGIAKRNEGAGINR